MSNQLRRVGSVGLTMIGLGHARSTRTDEGRALHAKHMSQRADQYTKEIKGMPTERRKNGHSRAAVAHRDAAKAYDSVGDVNMKSMHEKMAAEHEKEEKE